MARQNLDAAKLLHKSGHVRSCLSRASFSAYAAVTAALVVRGHKVSWGKRLNPRHDQIVRMAGSNLAAEAGREIKRRLRRLQAWRLAADYEPDSDLQAEESLEAVRSASEVVKLTGA